MRRERDRSYYAALLRTGKAASPYPKNSEKPLKGGEAIFWAPVQAVARQRCAETHTSPGHVPRSPGGKETEYGHLLPSKGHLPWHRRALSAPALPWEPGW